MVMNGGLAPLPQLLCWPLLVALGIEGSSPSDWIVRTAPMLTHLIGPEIMIPENATARLRFQHWICTEASWDGGAVEVSTDGGATWSHFGDGISGYYDVRSRSIQRPHSTGIGSGMVPVRWEDVVGLGGSNRRSAICQRMGGC